MFYMPSRVFFGNDALTRATERIRSLGQKALIVSGKSSARMSGALDDIERILSQNGQEWCLFDRVQENPSIDTIMSGVTEFVVNSCDFVIGIGGGSPLDAAKAISLVAANHTDRNNIYKAEKYKKSFPIVAIPTTSGTGTEVTPYSVLTDPKTQKKAGFGSELAFPTLAILVPLYTLTMTQTVTLNTGIDALSHLLEGIYSNKRNTVVFPMIFAGIKIIYENLPKVLQDPRDLSAREEMMRASLYGGMTIAHSSTTLQHSIGYPLTSVFGIPHGLANGLVMKGIMELYYPVIKKELDSLFASLNITQMQFYKWLEALKLSLDIRIPEAFIEDRTPEVMESRNMANNPFEIDPEDIRRIYRELKEKD